MNIKISKSAIYICFISLAAIHCGSAQIKDRDDLQKVHTQAEKGNKQGWDSYEKSLEVAKKEKNQDLQKMIIEDVASIPGKESREILKKEAESESPEVRSVAIEGFYSQNKTVKEPEEIKKETLQIIKKNNEKYNGPILKEIQILGNIKDEESENLLLNSLNNSNHTDEKRDTEIIKSLGSILSERQKEKSKLTEDRQDSEKIKKINSSIEKIEKSMIDQIKNNVSGSAKEAAISELYNSSAPNSQKKILYLYNSPDYDENSKVTMLKVLGSHENSGNSEIEKKLKQEYFQSGDLMQKIRILNRIGALTSKDIRVIKEELEKEWNEILRGKETKEVALSLDKLKQMFKKYNVNNEVVDKIQASTEELARDRKNPMKSGAVILFYGLQEIYPTMDYFELKKMGLQGLNVPGLFFRMMHSIDREYASYDMKILVIRSVWNIEENEAEKIYRAYLYEKR